ncbi:glycosyltransferase family 87 protein, partial [Acidobacteriota bacterium]
MTPSASRFAFRLKSFPDVLSPFMPLLPVVAGVIFLGWMLTFAVPHLHFSGDGSLKELLMNSWKTEGRLTSTIEWPHHSDWVDSLWERYGYPLGPPFLHKNNVVFPPFFLVLTFPFFAALGYAGLFVLPVLSVVGLWAVIWIVLRRQGFSSGPIGLALTLVVFSPVTYYGAMFWEHAPGLFFIFLPFALGLFEKDRGAWRYGLCGASLVFAVALRQELAPAALLFYIFGWQRSNKRYALLTGAVIAALCVFMVNLLATGTVLSLHGKQTFYLAGGDVLVKLAFYYKTVLRDFFAGALAILAVLTVGLASLIWLRDSKRERYVILGAVAFTLLVMPFIVPNFGGYQIFRRYELMFIPAGALVAAHLWRWHRILGIALLALILLDIPDLISMSDELRWAYGDRVATLDRAVEERQPACVITYCPTMPEKFSQCPIIELAWRIPEIPFVRARSAGELEPLIEDVARHVPVDRIALVVFMPRHRHPLLVQFSDGRELV